MAIRTISRVSGEALKTFDELTPEQLEEKLARAATAAESYRLTTIEQRVECPPSESAQASNLTFMSNWTSGGHFT